MLVYFRQLGNRLEETKGIEQLKTPTETEVEYPEKPSSKLESQEVKEFGGSFGVLLLQIISPLSLLAAHLYSSKVRSHEFVFATQIISNVFQRKWLVVKDISS
jgi:hypothetical protein